MYRNLVYLPQISYDCSVGGQQGNFGGAYSNALFESAGLNSSIPCNSVSSRATYGCAPGPLCNAVRSFETVVGEWSSSTGPSGSGLFAGTYWATRAFVYDESHSVYVEGFNC